MEIGVISDIHGNLAALQSVWSALARRGLTNGPVLNAGDNVGYGDAPEACVAFLRGHPQVVCVQGNYDRHIAHFPRKGAEYRKKWGRSRPPKFEAIQRDSRGISEETRAWLHDLPKERCLTLGNTPIFLTHYAPGVKEGLGTWTPNARLEELAGLTNVQVVVCGHTHTPFVRRAGGVLFVNPGTVGRGWHRQAAYAVLTVHSGVSPTALLHQVLIP